MDSVMTRLAAVRCGKSVGGDFSPVGRRLIGLLFGLIIN